MTEQEFNDLFASDIVRIVTTDRKFHLVTTHSSLCSHDVERNLGLGVPLGWLRCFYLDQGQWHSIDPETVYAWEALNHIMPHVLDSEPDPQDV
jgi:hypothetical protein